MVRANTQYVDLRCRNPRVFNAYDRSQEQAHDARMHEMRAAIPTHVKYVVAPGQSVTGRDGTLLAAGAHLTGPEDVAAAEDRPAWRVFDDAVFDGKIWQNYAYVPVDAAAR